MIAKIDLGAGQSAPPSALKLGRPSFADETRKLLVSAGELLWGDREKNMRKITKFEPLSVMKISAIVYALMGFLEGAIFSIGFSIARMATPNGRPMPRGFGLLFGGFSIILFPVLFAVMGAVFGGIGAAIYNVAAKWVGGIQVEVE